MLTVYVWLPSDSTLLANSSAGLGIGLGHASLEAGRTYISIWQASDSRYPFRQHRSFDEDFKRIRRSPEHTIELYALSEQPVREFWRDYQDPFHPINRNCCFVVAKALKLASEAYWDEQGINPLNFIAKSSLNLYSMVSSVTAWTPFEIIGLANTLKTLTD